MKKIQDIVYEVIVDRLGLNKDEITLTSHFENDLNADSLDVVEIIMEFEQRFDIAIPDDDAEKLTTVQSAIDYLEGVLVPK